MTVTPTYFMMYGLPCGLCGLPAQHIEVNPNGVRTAHVDPRKRPCDLTHAALKSPDRRVFEVPPPGRLRAGPDPAADRSEVP